MSDIKTLAAERRGRAGKGTARQTRLAGRIPAVIYGAKQPPLSISVEKFAFNRVLHQPGFFTHLFDVTVDGATHRVLPRDVQFDPVSDQPLHVDFLRVAADTKITVLVPIHCINQDKSPGIKRGGTINLVRHELEVTCAADAIPEHIDIDMEGLDLGASIHLSALKLPAGVTATAADHEMTVVTIAIPSGVKSDAEGAAEAAKA
jgi:large subunit ribosomal protein L25